MADSVLEMRQGSATVNEVLIDAKGSSNDSSTEFGLHLDGVPLIDKFVNRPLQIEQIRENLLSDAENHKRQVLVIYGEAGVGKTQLAIEFARRHKNDFSSVFWVDGTTEESLKWDIATLQHNLKGHVFSTEAQLYAQSYANLSRAVSEVLRWFSIKEHNRWLLVIDNLMEDAHSSGEGIEMFNLESYLPVEYQGCILITSRSAQSLENGIELKLGMLDNDQAESLLAEQIGRQSLGTRDQIKELLELLRRSPIAIKLASAFIKKTNTSLSDYIRLFKNTLVGLKKSGRTPEIPVDIGPKEFVLVSTSITYDHICCEDETAANFLKLWTYLDNGDLWYELFTPDFPLPIQSESLWWFRRAIRTPEGFAQAMDTLQMYGMIQPKGNSFGYFLHPVIAECARQTTFKDTDSEFAWLAVRTVGRATPSDSTEDERYLRQRLICHANRCYRLVVDNAAEPYFTLKNPFLPKGVKLDTALVYFSAVCRLGKLYIDTQKGVEGNELLLRASKGYSEILGAENDVTLEVISTRAALLVTDGKLDQAEELFLQVHQASENSPSASNSLTWTAAYNLAMIQQELGKLDLAEGTLRCVLNSVGSTAAIPDHPHAIRVIEALGAICLRQGKFGEAGDLYLRALPSQRTLLNPQYFELLKSMLYLALTCLCADKPAEAEKMALTCLHEYEEHSISDIPVSLGIVVAIGEMYQKQGQKDRAEHMFLQAVKGYDRIPGIQQKEMADTTYNLANFYTFQGRLEDAEKMVLRAIEGYKSALGADHHCTLDAMSSLANCQAQSGRDSEAEQTYLQVLESREKISGPNHRKTLETINNLGALYAGQDNFVEGERMYLRALDGFKTVFGPVHSITLSVLINMGSLYDSQDRRHDAVKTYLLALDGYKEVLRRLEGPAQGSESRSAVFGPAATNTSSTDNSTHVMYAQYSSSGDEDISAFTFGITMTLSELRKLASLLIRSMEWVDAEDVYLRLLSGQELAMGLKNPSTQFTIYALGKLFFYRCKHEAAAEQGEDLERVIPSQMNIGGWAEYSPIWRLALLIEKYKDNSAVLLGNLGKTLLPFGDAENAKAALRFELNIAINRGAGFRTCDRCETSIKPNKGWFACKSCFQDTDLCEPCYSSRGNGQWHVHSCCDHVFQDVFSANSPGVEGWIESNDLASWLSSLKSQYEAREYEVQEEEG